MNRLEGQLRQILAEKTRFGRVGVWYLTTNDAVAAWGNEFVVPSDWEYRPQCLRRAEKFPRIFWRTVPLLGAFVAEGLVNTVEFRRLARKYFRSLKSCGVDTVLVCDEVLADPVSQKVLRRIAGTQVRLVFVS